MGLWRLTSEKVGVGSPQGSLFALLVALAPHIVLSTDWSDTNIILNDGKWTKVYPEPRPGEAKPFPPKDDRWTSNHTSIIVLIAAFREKRCPDTLVSMFGKALNPKRIYAGVVQQNSPLDEDCLAGYCERLGHPLEKSADGNYIDKNQCPYFDHIFMKRLSDKEAKGPVYARALGTNLVDETHDYCMQIDAHTIFIEEWDRRMLNEWGATKNEYAILSTYPTNYKDLYTNSNRHWEMPHLCQATLSGMGKVANGRAGAAANLERPVLAPLWAAGLSFSRCHAERNIPNDINLKSVFAGEEYGRGARLWTHGYDFYSISRPIIGTYYGSDKQGGGAGHFTPGESSASSARLGTLLKWPGSDQSEEAIKKLGFYGLGTRRTLEQYAEWSGVNTIKGTSKQRCIVKYVSWNTPKTSYSEYQPTGPEVVKDQAWRDIHDGTTRDQGGTSTPLPESLGDVKENRVLLINVAIFASLSICCIFVLASYVAANHRQIVKPTIQKYTL